MLVHVRLAKATRPGGAIGDDGQSWLPSRADFFVPVRAKPMPVKHTPACPHCGGELKCIAMILASGACVPIPIRDSS